MRYRFIGAEKADYPITILCRVMQVSPSGYYAFEQRGPSARALANQTLLAEIKEIHEKSRGTYGSPRMHRADYQQNLATSVRLLVTSMTAGVPPWMSSTRTRIARFC